MHNLAVFAFALILFGLLLPHCRLPYLLWLLLRNKQLKALIFCLKLRNALLIRWHVLCDEFLVFLKHRMACIAHFLTPCFHRPPPVVGRPRNVNKSDRHKSVGSHLV